MASLGEFIGALMAELATARMRADAHSIHIADLYAGHDLLSHLSIPRFRLPEVRIDLPVIIDDLDESSKDGRLNPSEAQKIALGEIDDLMVDTPISARTRTALEERLKARIDALLRAELQPSMRLVADEVLAAITDVFSSDQNAIDRLSELRPDLARRIMRKLALLVTSAVRIRVDPRTSSLKEVRESDRVARIYLTLSEDAVEWTVIETATGERKKLVPE